MIVKPIIIFHKKNINSLIFNLFTSGFPIRNEQQWFLYFIGVIADCPTMKLVLNHIGHNGYFSCSFCKIEGIHMDNKRQYHFEEALCMRMVGSYLYQSRKADTTGKHVKGHLGTTFLYQILDVPLPGFYTDELYAYYFVQAHAQCCFVDLSVH